MPAQWGRTSLWRAVRTLLCAASLCTLSSCATLVAIVVSPVAVPISFVKNFEPQGWYSYALLPLAIPYAFVVAPLTGLRVDDDFMHSGTYEHFDWVLDPLAHLPGH